MLIPTNYLRQVEVFISVPHDSEEDFSQPLLTGYRLKQWWSNDGSGPEAKQGEIVPDPTNTTMAYVTFAREGEWRDVPIEGE